MKAICTISKTIQDRQYEPFQVSITLEKEVKTDDDIDDLSQQCENAVKERLEIHLESMEK